MSDHRHTLHHHPQPDDLRMNGQWRARLGDWKRRLAGQAAAPLQDMFGSRVGGALGVLMYHRVAPVTPDVAEPTWNVEPHQFEAQLAGLLQRGFQPVRLRDALRARRDGAPLPEKAFVVTFDDGYENVHRFAWPILMRLNVPATVFLATAFLDSPQPYAFDDWTAAGSQCVPACHWRPMTTEQCGELAESGLIELGSHTHTHADFRGKPIALRRDIRESLRQLRKRFGLEDATFAFPYGTKKLGFAGGPLTAAAREAGVLCSLTTEGELVPPGRDPFDWGRFTAESFDTGATLAAKLGGWFGVARRAWRWLRRPFEGAVRPVEPVCDIR